jgi:hypothetical protein
MKTGWRPRLDKHLRTFQPLIWLTRSNGADGRVTAISRAGSPSAPTVPGKVSLPIKLKSPPFFSPTAGFLAASERSNASHCFQQEQAK